MTVTVDQPVHRGSVVATDNESESQPLAHRMDLRVDGLWLPAPDPGRP